MKQLLEAAVLNVCCQKIDQRMETNVLLHGRPPRWFSDRLHEKLSMVDVCGESAWTLTVSQTCFNLLSAVKLNPRCRASSWQSWPATAEIKTAGSQPHLRKSISGADFSQHPSFYLLLSWVCGELSVWYHLQHQDREGEERARTAARHDQDGDQRGRNRRGDGEGEEILPAPDVWGQSDGGICITSFLSCDLSWMFRLFPLSRLEKKNNV